MSINKKTSLGIITGIACFGMVLAIGAKANTAPVKAEGYEFNEKTDEVLDDFHLENAGRTVSNGVVNDFDKLVLDVTASDGTTADASLYKAGIKTPNGWNSGVLRISMLSTSDTIDWSKLTLSLYGDDAWTPINKGFDQLLDSNGNASCSAYTKGEFFNFDIDFMQSYEGDDYYEGQTVTPNSVEGIRRFHIINNGFEGHLEIKSLETIVSGVASVFDDFNRAAKGTANDNQYWTDSVGRIEHVNVKVESGSYKLVKNAAIAYNNIGVEVEGSLSGVKFVNAQGEESASMEIKDHTGAAPAISGKSTVIINPVNCGYTGEVAGFVLEGSYTLSRVFGTNIETREAEVIYPALDVENAQLLENFNITYNPTTDGAWATAYEAGVTSETNFPKFYERGINAVVNWASASEVSFNGESLVLPALSAGQDYASFYMGMPGSYTDAEYLVIKLKATDCALAGNFRFVAGSNDVLWHHNAYSAFKLKAPEFGSGLNPYCDIDGFEYMIYSIEENNLDPAKLNGEFTFYWGQHEGTIEISEIFYAKAAQPELVKKSCGAPSGDASGYMYFGYVEAGAKYIEFTLTAGETGFNTSNWRIEQSGGPTPWVKDGGVILADGSVFPVETIPAGESKTYKIDLVASGYDVTKSEHFHAHNYGSMDPEHSAVTLNDAYYYMAYEFKRNLLTSDIVVPAGTGYNWGGVYGNGEWEHDYVSDTLRFTFEVEETITNGLLELRFQIAGKVVWFASYQADHFLDVNGKPITQTDLVAGTNVIEVSLSKSGLDPYKVANMEFGLHETNNGSCEIVWKGAEFVGSLPLNIMTLVPAKDFEAPKLEVSLSPAENAQRASDVTVTAVATDDITLHCNVTIEVTLGSGDSLEHVTVTNGKFTPNKTGTYTVTVVATDDAGKQTTVVKTITVVKNAQDIAEEEAARAAAELAAAKTAAIEELSSYKDPENYSKKNQEVLAKAVEDGKAAINGATSIEAVNQALAAAKASIDTIKVSGCAASVVATSLIVTLASLIGTALVSLKKKED